MVKCAICGKEVPEKDTEKMFTGRRKYVCFECYKQGQKENDVRELSLWIRRNGSE